MPADKTLLMSVVDLKTHFKVKDANGKKAVVRAVDGVSFDIYGNETFGLVGESGCGKSTLGRTLLTLNEATCGKVEFLGQNVFGLKGSARKQFRSKAQLIFQDPSACLNPRRRIKDILMEPFIIHDILKSSERKARIQELMDMVGLSQSYMERYPHEMSGGQKQRVGIARALAIDPKLLVCDEPVSALDVSIQAQVINLLEELQGRLSLTYMFISHDLSVVHHIADRVGVMYLGRFVELAPKDELYSNPLHPYTKALLSSIPRIGAKQGEAQVLSGDVPSPSNPPAGCRFHTRCPEVMDVCRADVPPLIELESGHFVACHLYPGVNPGAAPTDDVDFTPDSVPAE